MNTGDRSANNRYGLSTSTQISNFQQRERKKPSGGIATSQGMTSSGGIATSQGMSQPYRGRAQAKSTASNKEARHMESQQLKEVEPQMNRYRPAEQQTNRVRPTDRQKETESQMYVDTIKANAPEVLKNNPKGSTDFLHSSGYEAMQQKEAEPQMNRYRPTMEDRTTEHNDLRGVSPTMEDRTTEPQMNRYRPTEQQQSLIKYYEPSKETQKSKVGASSDSEDFSKGLGAALAILKRSLDTAPTNPTILNYLKNIASGRHIPTEPERWSWDVIPSRNQKHIGVY
jgi:hypothetical protein